MNCKNCGRYFDFVSVTHILAGGTLTFCSEGCKKSFEIKENHLENEGRQFLQGGEMRNELLKTKFHAEALIEEHKKLRLDSAEQVKLSMEVINSLLHTMTVLVDEISQQVQEDEAGSYVAVRLSDLGKEWQEALSPSGREQLDAIVEKSTSEFKRFVDDLESTEGGGDVTAHLSKNPSELERPRSSKRLPMTPFEWLYVAVLLAVLFAFLYQIVHH